MQHLDLNWNWLLDPSLLKRLADLAAYARVTANAQAVPAMATFLMQGLVM
jgi:hypothetical protein